MIDKIIVGTRGSELALAQTRLLIEEVKKKYPDITCEIKVIHTMGDKILDKPLLSFGGKGAFVTEFEEELLSGSIDLAVHSSKDMPMKLESGLAILGVLKREDPRDVLISKKGCDFLKKKELVIGTSSLRRQFQIEKLIPNCKTKSIRGNVNTRLRKLLEGEYDAIILAAAGINRLNLQQSEEFEYRYFTYEEMIPAAGQGIIAIEGKKDSEVSELMLSITDAKANIELETERAALHLLEAGCHEPIGIFSEVFNNEIEIRMMKADGEHIVCVKKMVPLDQRASTVAKMVEELKEGM